MTGSDLSSVKGIQTLYISDEKEKNAPQICAHNPDTTGFYLLKDKQFCVKKQKMQLSVLTIFIALKKFRKCQVILKLHYSLVIFQNRVVLVYSLPIYCI